MLLCSTILSIFEAGVLAIHIALGLVCMTYNLYFIGGEVPTEFMIGNYIQRLLLATQRDGYVRLQYPTHSESAIRTTELQRKRSTPAQHLELVGILVYITDKAKLYLRQV